MLAHIPFHFQNFLFESNSVEINYFFFNLISVDTIDLRTVAPKKIKTEKRRLEPDLLPAAKRERINNIDDANLETYLERANTDPAISPDEMVNNGSHTFDLSDDAAGGINMAHLCDVQMDVTNESFNRFDSDYCFLVSLHEFIRPIPLDKKLSVHIAITNAIAGIIANVNENQD